MDNRYYDSVIKEMKPFLDENGLKEVEGGFANETKKIAVRYDDAKQTYSLFVAVKDEEGNFGEETAVNTWLFDDSQTEKDAVSVGIDFVNSLRKELGVKMAKRGADVSLPTASKNGGMNVTGFAKKMLDVFPVLKDDYKEHIAVYGNFLYLNFFGEKLVPQMISLFENGTKKQIKKLYDVFEDAYVKGDKDTVNVMIAVITACGCKNVACDTAIKEMLSDNKHFLQAYESFKPMLLRDKKLYSALVK